MVAQSFDLKFLAKPTNLVGSTACTPAIGTVIGMIVAPVAMRIFTGKDLLLSLITNSASAAVENGENVMFAHGWCIESFRLIADRYDRNFRWDEDG